MESSSPSDSDDWPPGPGNFGYFTRIEVNPLNPTTVTAVAFDPIEEIIWSGNSNGKIASFCGENSYSKYSAFASFNTEIRDLDINQYGVFSLSATHLRLHSRQGIGIATFTSRNMENLNCMYRFATAPTILLGGDQKKLIQFDLEKQKEIRVANMNEKNAMIIRSSGQYIYSADTEGNIAQRSLSLDTLRMLPKVHGGPIQDFDISGNKLITCGCSFRVNSLHGDPYVKVYDLRMFQAQKPLALSFAPVFTRFLPTFYDTRAIFCSQMGEAQINDVNGLQVGSPLLIESGFALTAFGVSSTYQMIAFGDECGNIHVYSDRPSPTINDESYPTEFADSVLGLPQSFGIDDTQTALASIPMPFSTDDTLLSDWPEDLTEIKYRVAKPLGHYQNVKTIQYITYAPNPKAGTPFQFFNTVPYFLEEVPIIEEAITDRPIVIPQFYRRIKTPKCSTKKSTAAVKSILRFNKTATVPLAYMSSPVAGVNPFVHLLYIVPAFRNIFLCHLCEDEHCIACQLGFLFRMMSDHSRYTAASSSNLLRSIMASGFPKPWKQPVVSSQEIFNFLVTGIGEAFIGPEQRQIVADLLETVQAVNSRCVRCGEVTPGEEKKMIITLQYSNVADHLTLSSLIEKALHQRSQKEEECPSCKTVTRLEETRKVKKLPPILLVDANPSADRYLSFWEEQLQISEKRPKYKSPEQEYALGTGGKTEKICRYGADCRNKSTCKYSHGMGDWETECEIWLSDTGGEWKHFISKTFSAKLSNGIAILSENPGDTETTDVYELVGAVVEILIPPTSKEEEAIKHVVTLLKTNEHGNPSWVIVNDVLVTEIHQGEALHLDHRWKLPLAFIYASTKSGVMNVAEKRSPISPDVFQLDSNLAGNQELLNERKKNILPKKGDLVGIDAEFVDELGKKSVGRVSCVDASGERILIDDYVITCEGNYVNDYLTAYSGIMEEDLDPARTTKHLTTLKRVYLKILHLVEKGVVFVGHGLQNDFAVLNIYVPFKQTRDTVNLFHLPDKRCISLQFLAWHLLGEKIQETTHDSVVDARVALLLYKKYLQFQEEGTLLAQIQHLYEIGNQSNWRLSESPTKSVSPCLME